MATVSDISERKGVKLITLESGTVVRVRSKHFDLKPVAVGDSIDKSYIDSLAALQFNDCYEAALSILDYSAKTEKELRGKLKLNGYVKPAVEASIERLKQAGLIDDMLIAERIVKCASDKTGVYAIKRKLAQKGIAEETGQEALFQLTDEQQLAAAKAVIGKYQKRYEDLPERERRAKLSQALARRGFAWSVISTVLSD